MNLQNQQDTRFNNPIHVDLSNHYDKSFLPSRREGSLTLSSKHGTFKCTRPKSCDTSSWPTFDVFLGWSVEQDQGLISWMKQQNIEWLG